MALAMRKLDEIMNEIKTGEDLNNDGVIGMPARSFASQVDAPKDSAGPTRQNPPN
jgi:hypothetical protein